HHRPQGEERGPPMIARVDPTVVALLPVLGSILGIALAAIAGATVWLRTRQPELVRELWLRYGSWLVVSLVVLVALGLARGAWIALVAVLSLAAFREYCRAVGLSWDDLGFVAVGFLAIVAIYACVWWPFDPADPGHGWYGLFMAMPAYVTLTILAVPIMRDE